MRCFCYVFCIQLNRCQSRAATQRIRTKTTIIRLYTMYVKQTVLVLLSAWLVSGQRPSFAGTLPIGFPILTNKTSSDSLGNRFGEDLVLPIEAKGDRDLVERISKMPIDQQPFWYINWKALEEQRKNPQTFEQKPNVFLNGPLSQNSNFVPPTNNFNSGLTPKFGNENSLTPKFGNENSVNSFNQNQGQRNYRLGRRYYRK